MLWRQLDSDQSGEVSVEEAWGSSQGLATQVVQFLYRVDLSSWPKGSLKDVRRAVRRLNQAGCDEDAALSVSYVQSFRRFVTVKDLGVTSENACFDAP